MDNRDYTFYIAGTPKQVWDVLTAPDGTKKILFGSVIKSTFKAGDPLEFVGPGADGADMVHIYGKIIAFEPEKVFSYTDHPGTSYDPNHAETEYRVSYTLEPVGKCTKLTLVVDQWSANRSHDQEYLWWIILSNIKSLVETGKTLELG